MKRYISSKSITDLTNTTALLFLALALGACGGSSAPTSPGGPSVEEAEYQSTEAVNQTRQSSGLARLRAEREQLLEIAREHSEAMRDQGFVGHVGPDGRDLRQRLTEAGFRFTLAGENVARISDPIDPAGAAHSGFLQSPSHRLNILGPEYELIAVGVAQAGDTYWFTQIYICP